MKDEEKLMKELRGQTFYQGDNLCEIVDAMLADKSTLEKADITALEDDYLIMVGYRLIPDGKTHIATEAAVKRMLSSDPVSWCYMRCPKSLYEQFLNDDCGLTVYNVTEWFATIKEKQIGQVYLERL